ncbi:MAG: hypothetical protein ACO1SX_18060 [Actinomycetota bacterium]
MADSRGRTSSRHAGRPAPSRWRTVLVIAGGLAVIGSAYQFAFASGPVGFLSDYGPTTDTGDETGAGPGGIGSGTLNRSNLALAGASSGGDALIGALAIGAFSECTMSLPALPSDQTQLSAVELSSRSSVVEAGSTTCFHLHGKSAKDGKWYDVTDRPETRIDLGSAQSGLIRQQGSSHRFSLPITVGRRVNNATALVVGRFEAAGSPALTSEATVTLRVVQ